MRYYKNTSLDQLIEYYFDSVLQSQKKNLSISEFVKITDKYIGTFYDIDEIKQLIENKAKQIDLTKGVLTFIGSDICKDYDDHSYDNDHDYGGDGKNEGSLLMGEALSLVIAY